MTAGGSIRLSFNVGLYGKIPAQGDFVRVNASDPQAMALDQWLQEALEALQRAGSGLPQEPVYFVFRAAGGPRTSVGVFAPSADSVGRQFPLVVFATLDSAVIAPRFSAVPVAFARFLMEGADLVARASQLNAARLTEVVRTLTVPSESDLRAADDICRQTLTGTSAPELQRRLFGDAVGGRHYYAFKTFTDACSAVRGKEPAKPGVTLDCPIASDVDLFAWLELSRRLLRWTDVPPPFFWSEGALPRLLLSLGPPPSALLLYLAKPDHTGAKLWPLLTERGDAIETSKQSLPAPHRRAIDENSSSLESLIAALST